MKRQTINIGDFKYIVDLYDATIDYSPVIQKEYYIIRNVEFIGNVAYDTDIYFIEKEIYEKMKENNTITTDLIAFPYHNSNFGSFSNTLSDFSNIIANATFNIDTNGGNVFTLKRFNKDINEYSDVNAFLVCDKIKIYHPHNKTDLDYIIYLDNTINGIHFHYYCNLSKNCQYNSEELFTINNITYSEYIELYIPNINYLFKESKIIKDNDGNIIEDNNVYFNDFYNIIKYAEINEQTYKKISRSKVNTNTTWLSLKNKDTIKSLFEEELDKMSFVPLYLLLNPFITYENSDKFEEKIYFKLNSSDVNNYNSLPINITLYPYKDPEPNNNIYLYNDNYPPNSDVFTKDFKFVLRSYLDFYSTKLDSKPNTFGSICVKSIFDFYNKQSEDNPTGLTVQEAYALYNGLQWIPKEDNPNEYYCPEYEGWINWQSETLRINEELRKYNEAKMQNKIYIMTHLDGTPITDEEIEDFYKQQNGDDDDFEDDSYIKCCGYQIDIASDFEFRNIIATDYIEKAFITDFDFSLLQLFDNWFNIPNVIIIRIKFIDKYLGVNITSGFIVLNKEWLKYTINDLEVPRLYQQFVQNQTILTNVTDMSWNTLDANKTNFNFIDKLNCIITKQNDNINSQKLSSNNVKILYKPIFYKAQDLQSITLLTGMKQKIGINLSEYMTKVSIFKLVIGEFEYSEFGRNDIYVIFDIDANVIEGQTGIYNIVDSGDVYISSGTWTKK